MSFGFLEDAWFTKESLKLTRVYFTAYYIAFGPHGPRAEAPPGEGWKIVRYTTFFVGVSFALFFFTRMFARGPPKTMAAEWQEATNEYMKVRDNPYYHIR